MNVNLWDFVAPFVLMLARISAFFMVLPIFGWTYLPTVVRAGIAMLVTLFYLIAMGPPAVAGGTDDLFSLTVVLVQEVFCGLGLGLAASFIFLSVQQAGKILSQLMGLSDAGIIDPVSGEESDVMEMFLELTFMVLFLAAGGHHLLLSIIGRSYQAFPVGSGPHVEVLTEVLVSAGADMMVFSLKICGPALAAFGILTLALAVLSKAMPDMNILYMSFPFRIGLGVFLAAAMVPTLSSFTSEFAQWMGRLVGG